MHHELLQIWEMLAYTRNLCDLVSVDIQMIKRFQVNLSYLLGSKSVVLGIEVS